MSLLEDEDDDPEGGGERDQVQHHGLDCEHDRAERPREQDQRQDQDEGEHVGEAAEQGVQEVAVDRGDAGQRAVGALRGCALARSMIAWMPGAEPSMAGNASTSESGPRCQLGGAVAPTTPGTVRSLAAICWALPPCSTSTSSGFITPGLMPAAASWSRPAIAVPVPGKFFSWASFGFSCVPQTDEHGDDHQADGGDRDRAPQHEARPAAPGAVLGVAAVDEPARHDADAVDPLAETASSAGSKVSEASTETAGISMPPMPIERMQRQRQHDHREQTDRDRRAGDDHGAAGVGHRLDER